MSALKKTAAVQTAETTPDAELNWNRRILVVDDEPEILSIYEDILKEKGEAPAKVVSSRSSRSEAKVIPLPSVGDKFQFVVDTASSAGEALLKVKALEAEGGSYAMGFFDVRLGEGKDGIELVKDIHDIFPDMYSVFVTAYNDRTIESITAALGADRTDRWDYMNKPFNKSEIQQKARNFVALWNLQKEKQQRDEVLSDLNRRVLESERVTSVAAVARGVAHEFGNLLMQIMGKAEVSRNKSQEDMQKALDKIIDASQRAHEILDRFDHLSDTKTKSTLKTWCQVEKIVDEAIDLISHQFKKTRTKIEILKKDPVKAKVNSTTLLQVQVNLFINALHAMGDGGQIDISLEKNDKDFCLTVRDHGPGVPPELMEKVLEPFFTTKGEKGTGLGLAISREIIEIDHGGDFQLKNHAKGGLQVIMTIPIQMEASNE